MALNIPDGWKPLLKDEISQPHFEKLAQFLKEERRKYQVFPLEQEVFNALELTPYQEVKVLLLGQDPYHNEGQAHGLAFSVRPGTPIPPSLLNIFKELQADTGIPIPNHGSLKSWARQGVLLLNAVLTVRAHQPNSHKNKGWERFSDAVIAAVNEKPGPIVFLLWGNYARKKTSLIDTDRHVVLQAAHPSPLSANRGYFGSRPFSKTNAVLVRAGKEAIDWQIPLL
jgi:uracil-DNA glycosylase